MKPGSIWKREEDRAEKPFDRFTDMSKLDAVDLELQFVLKIHLLVTDHPPLECAMIETREETAKWLGVSTETPGNVSGRLQERKGAVANLR